MIEINNIIDLNNFCVSHGFVTKSNFEELINSDKELTIDNIIPYIEVASPEIWYILTTNEEVEDNIPKAILDLFTSKDIIITLNGTDDSAPKDYIYGADLIYSDSDFYIGTFRINVNTNYVLNIAFKSNSDIEHNLLITQINSPDLLQLLHEELQFTINTITMFVNEKRSKKDQSK